MLSGEMQDSVPPQTMAVAAPCRMKLVASPEYKKKKYKIFLTITSKFILFYIPIECAPVAQAVETEWLGPSNLCLMLIWPAAMLVNILGTK